MNTKQKLKVLFKPFSMLFMSCMLAVSLTSCGSKADLYNGINPDEVYTKFGEYSVTNKEVYDNLRWNASSFMTDKINETIYKSYLDDVKATIENPTTDSQKANQDKYIKQIHEYVFVDVYALSSLEDYENINNPYVEVQKEQQYIAGLIESLDVDYHFVSESSGVLKAEDQLKADALLSLITADFKAQLANGEKLESTMTAEKLNGNADLKNIFKNYYEKVAKKLFAAQYLEDEIKEYNEEMDEDDDPYFTDSEIKTYWENNYEVDTPLEALAIRFIDNDEVNAVLKTFGLKVYRSKLYFISQEGVVRPNNNKELTDAQYSKWYDEFDFTKTSNLGNDNAIDLSVYEDTGLMLALYIEIYNYIYSYREPIKSVLNFDTTSSNRRDTTAKLINAYAAGGELNGQTAKDVYNKCLAEKNFDDYEEKDYYNKYIQYTGEELDSISTNLRTYIYDTLELEDNKNYSTAGQSCGTYYYLAYKISDPEIAEANKLYYADDDEEEIDHTKNTDLIDTIIAELKDEILTDTYIDSAISTSAADASIYIYDEALEIVYSSANASYSKTRKKSPKDGVIFTVKYEDTKVDYTSSQLWEELEVTNGLSTAFDIVAKRIIMNTDTFKAISEDKEKTELYYNNFEVLLTNFASDQLSSYGYSSSIGKYNFLMLYYHTTDVETIINEYYRLNEASNELLHDYTSRDLANTLKLYSDNYFDNYFSASASNLLVYVDMDEDGNPDYNFNWDQSLKTFVDGCKTYKDLAMDLINKIINITYYSSKSNVEAISSIVSDYNSSSRFENGYNSQPNEDGDYDPTEPEKYWAKYRAAGLFIKTEELTSVSNTTDYATCYDVLKIAMYKAYNDSDYIFDGDTPQNEYMLSSYYEGGDGLLSVAGYNLLVMTSATINESAEFTAEDDEDGIYTDLVYQYKEEFYKISDLYSDGDYLSTNQIIAYLLEYSTTNASMTLPESVNTAITTYFSNVYTRFTNEATQFRVLLTYLMVEAGLDSFDDIEFKSTNQSVSTERLIDIIELNKLSTDGYLVKETVYDSNTKLTFFKDGDTTLFEMEDLYTISKNDGSTISWWDSIEEYVSNAFSKEDK